MRAGTLAREAFVLGTTLTDEELVRFFLDEYRPSPIISPWNGGSGFFPNDNPRCRGKLGFEPLANAAAKRIFRLQVRRWTPRRAFSS